MLCTVARSILVGTICVVGCTSGRQPKEPEVPTTQRLNALCDSLKQETAQSAVMLIDIDGKLRAASGDVGEFFDTRGYLKQVGGPMPAEEGVDPALNAIAQRLRALLRPSSTQRGLHAKWASDRVVVVGINDNLLALKLFRTVIAKRRDEVRRVLAGGPPPETDFAGISIIPDE